MKSFFEQQGWTLLEKLPQDGGLRSYARIEKNGMQALYMDCGPTEDVSHVTKVSDFISIGGWLNSIDLRTPEIYELFEDRNAAIIEDFGKISVKQAIVNGVDTMQIYEDAAEILTRIQNAKCSLPLPQFQTSFMRNARQRFIDWYVPVIRGQENSSALVEEYRALWDGIEKSIGEYGTCFMHVDYHVENLMYLGGQGTNSLGIIDFQEAMFGPESYDLVNLLEDMRADVPLDVQQALLKDKSEQYKNWYRVLGTQFHCRLMGQILRWAIAEDKQGYMQYYPRLIGYVERALKDPVLEPFKLFLQREKINLLDAAKLDWKTARKFIHKDAI